MTLAPLAAAARAWHGTALLLTPETTGADVLGQLGALGMRLWSEQGRLKTDLARAFTVTEAAVLSAYMAGIEGLLRAETNREREAR